MRQATLNTQAVKDLMASLGVDSVSELARLSGIERSYLSRIIDGNRTAQPSHVIKLANALRVAPIALLGPADPDAAVAELDAAVDDKEEELAAG